ncbi:MAG: hypothetical protein JNL08_18315 [Planctomycetes bacterium]|nr:hypothetical protein [Planctomycetota bacterium]
MTVLQITCDNCGAKYKLPESFPGTQAKCQKCGSVIDVARQRAAAAGGTAAASPAAAAKPAAAARPAVDRSKAQPKEPAKPAASAAKPSRAARTSARGAKAAADDGDGDEAPRRGGREAKKKSAMPLIASGIGLVAIVVVAVVAFGGGGDEPAKQDTAQQTPAKAAAPADKPAEKPADKPAEPPAGSTPPAPTPTPPAAAPAKPADAAPAEASTPPPAAEPEDPSAPKRPWQKMRNPPQSMDQVTDPKSYPEVSWPADIADDRKAKLRGLAEEAATDTGLRGIRAMKALAEDGYGATFAIVERLRLINYMSTEDSMTAFALNKAIEEITAGLNARFEPVEANEMLAPAKAEWNTRTVQAWQQILAKYTDEEAFKKDRSERLKKQAEANK